MRRLLFVLSALLSTLVVPSLAAGPKVALLSTEFVLERKFQEMQKAATAVGVTVTYLHVDHASPDAIHRAIDGAALVIVDTPRAEDQAAVEKAVGGLLRERQLPTMNVMTMSPPRTRRDWPSSADTRSDRPATSIGVASDPGGAPVSAASPSGTASDVPAGSR